MPAIPAPETPLSRFQAQRKLGLFAGLDYTVAAVLLFSWLTLGFWKLFGHPELLQLVVFAIVNIVLMQLWLIVLLYRVLVFVLDLGADINLMPEAAARIVVGYWEGRTK